MSDQATFVDALGSDGEYTLSVELSDWVGNTSSIDYATLLIVDATLPTSSITTPADLAVLGAGDDASADAGYQVDVTGMVGDTRALSAWTLLYGECTDATYASCAAGTIIASGSVGGTSSSIDETPTISLSDVQTYHELTLRALDEAGNSLDAVVHFEININM